MHHTSSFACLSRNFIISFDINEDPHYTKVVGRGRPFCAQQHGKRTQFAIVHGRLSAFSAKKCFSPRTIDQPLLRENAAHSGHIIIDIGTTALLISQAIL